MAKIANKKTPTKANQWALVDLAGFINNANFQAGAATGAELQIIIDEKVIPASQFSMTYGLNSLPRASAQIALGRDARTNQPSTIYSQIAAIKQMSPVRVELTGVLGDFTASGTNGKRKKFPKANATLFMGYVLGLSYRRSSGRVTLVINMVSQLFDLAASSSGSRDVIPGAPHDFLLPTLGFGPGGQNNGDAAARFNEDLSENLVKDYSFAVLNCLKKIANENFLQTHSQELWCGGQNAPALKAPNSRALAALSENGKWEGISNLSESKYLSKYSTKYPLVAGNAISIDKAANTIGSQLASSLASNSMWDVLIGLILPSFGCGIVPLARGAVLAPILPMAKKHQISLRPEDYVDFNMNTQSQRPLYGVGVMGTYVLGTMTPDDPKYCVGATYVAKVNPKEAVNDGMWLFVPAPKWLDDFSNFDPKAIKGDADVLKMLGQPGHAAVGEEQAGVERDQKEELAELNSQLGKYAQMMYATQALKGRDGTITGKLRFDIAPGTTIKIKSKGEAFSAGTDSLATDMFAFVSRVTVSINAEQAAALTTLELTNLRTEAENNLANADEPDSGRFAFAKHPFFGENYFKYAPIVPELSLDPET